MTGTVVDMGGGRERTTADMLMTIDKMRELIAAGGIVAIAAVLVESSDATRFFTATAGPVSILRTVGATAALHHAIVSGDLGR